jgi:hypothetical protein
MDLHDAEQSPQVPGATVLQRPLCATARAAAPALAVFLRLRLNQLALQPGQNLFRFRQRQTQRLR